MLVFVIVVLGLSLHYTGQQDGQAFCISRLGIIHCQCVCVFSSLYCVYLLVLNGVISVHFQWASVKYEINPSFKVARTVYDGNLWVEIQLLVFSLLLSVCILVNYLNC
jgi:uncharacterized membrane protein YesL